MKSIFRLSQHLPRYLYLLTLLVVSARNCPGQAPVFTNAAVVNGLFQFQLKTVVGQSYTFETSTNLLTWTSVGSIANVTTNLLSLADSQHPVASYSRKFYRARVGVDITFSLNFHEYANAGNFGGGLTPVTSFPVFLNSYSADFAVQNDLNFPPATNVFFTGPAGSGLSNTPADPSSSNTNNSNEGDYQSPFVSSPAAAPGGTWTVAYKGTNLNFNITDPQAASRLVIPVPTASVLANVLQSVSWVYQDATTGATLGGAPAYVTSIQLQIEGYVGGRIYNSPNLMPAVTSHTLTSSVSWTNVSSFNLAYNDSLGNHYVVFFQKP
ncbi:MAG: hypothetical protein JF609_00195 [Verrucomicrobia bacterium]|nr:hypothetical protein [Verrucomicrobiota bacterium]